MTQSMKKRLSELLKHTVITHTSHEVWKRFEKALGQMDAESVYLLRQHFSGMTQDKMELDRMGSYKAGEEKTWVAKTWTDKTGADKPGGDKMEFDKTTAHRKPSQAELKAWLAKAKQELIQRLKQDFQVRH